jgi:ribosomal protein L11 methyltransferase
VSPETAVAAAYWRVRVTLAPAAPEASEALTNFLWELGAVGVVEEVREPGAELGAYFPPGARPADLERRVRAYVGELAGLAAPVGPVDVRIEPLADGDWAEAWRAHFRPLRVGTRLLVCPPWDVPDAPAGGRLRLVIEPGRAFGVGSHGSTRTCLELLERALAGRPVEGALDLGCGSGILAIAAARLGAGIVEAVDVDPDAVAATRENALRNGVADRVSAAVAAIEAWPGPARPLVTANLLAAAHVVLAPVLAGLTAPAGTLIAGGLLVHEVPAVAGAFVAAGYRLVETAEHEGWAALRLRRGRT